MKTIKVWACQANHDRIEGKGGTYNVCYASTKDLALKIVTNPTYYKQYGIQGCPPYKGGEYDVKEIEMVVYNTLEEYFDSVKNIAIKTALEKLTDEEKNLLGLR